MSNKKEIYLIMHDIRSAWNVGSMFRTADAIGVKKIYLGGYTATPEHPKVQKTSLGAENYVSWEKQKQTWRVLKKLKSQGVQIVALEQAKNSEDIFKFKPKFPMALVVGNEVRGLQENILKYTDDIVEIPMFGKKESLNVAVAFGIAVYAFTT